MTLVGVECLADVREVHVISGGHSYFWQDFIVVKILLCSLERGVGAEDAQSSLFLEHSVYNVYVVDLLLHDFSLLQLKTGPCHTATKD